MRLSLWQPAIGMSMVWLVLSMCPGPVSSADAPIWEMALTRADELAEVFHEIRDQESGVRSQKSGMLLADATQTPHSALRTPHQEVLLAAAGFQLPADSKLEIQGRKSVGFKMSGTRYFAERPGQPPPPGATFGLEQELQVRLSGTISKRVTVNVDYDDTKPAEDQQRDISVFYKGEPQDVVQEAAFGDVTLVLPNTEFTGYNKKVFGAQIKGAYSGFKFSAIGAQTKGKTKTVSFTGRNTQIKKDIQDTEFIQRKYYQIAMTLSHRAITSKSEQIWVDNRLGTDDKVPPNDAQGNPNRGGPQGDPTLYTQPTEPSKSYNLDYQSPGKDYTIDYDTGVITFVRTLPEHYVVLVAYQYAGGTQSVGYNADGSFNFSDADPAFSSHVIQRDATDTSHQIKNVYHVGNQKLVPREYDSEFVFQVFDASGQEVSVNNFPTTFDVDFGIFRIFDGVGGSEPFAKDSSGAAYQPNAYSQTSRQSRYRMHIEYKYRYRDYVLPDRPIVKYSEKVVLDGKDMRRDEDYIIDYASGFVFFNNPDIIKDTSQLSITYEVLPFGGQFQSNLFGLRGEWALNERMFLGSSFLFSGGQVPLDVPVVGSTPRSHQILDLDAKLGVTPDQMKLFTQALGLPEGILPTSFDLSGELAKSTFNPNTFTTDTGEQGAAFIDSMEGIDELTGASTTKTAWFQAGRPAQDPSPPSNSNRTGPIGIGETVDERGHDTSIQAGNKTLLKLTYNLQNGEWDSVRTLISNSGSDWTRFTAVEMWVKTDWSQPVEFHTEFGIISEDTNESGLLDTEDLNRDNQLGPSEDTGVPVQYRGQTVTLGAGDGFLQSEDVDRSGRLDTTESYYRHSFTVNAVDAALISRTAGEWRLIKIPITSFTATGSPTPSDRRLIKHLRLWVKGTGAASGVLTIESVQASGNKWEQYGTLTGGQKFAIRAISSDTDPAYIPLTGTFYRVTTSVDKTREKALSMAYLTTSDNVMARRIFPTAINFLEFGRIRMDVYKKTVNAGDTLVLRLGPDETNYFQYEKALDGVAAGAWDPVEIVLEGADVVKTVVGTPNLTNIKQLALGVKSASATEGEVWVNNLRVNDVKKDEGIASRLSGNFKFGDWLGLTTSYRQMDSRFRLIDDASTNTSVSVAQAYQTQRQTSKDTGVTGTFNLIPFMPTTFGVTRREVVTDGPDRTNPNFAGVPDKITDGYVASVAFRLIPPLQLGVDGTYQTDAMKWLPTAVSADNSDLVTWGTTFKGTYQFPDAIPWIGINIGRNTLEGSYIFRRTSDLHAVRPDIRNSEADSREQTYRWSGQYNLIDAWTLSPSLNYRFLDQKGARERWVPSLGDRTPATTDHFEPQTMTRGAGLETAYAFWDRKITVGSRFGATNTTDYLRDDFRTENNIEYSVGFAPPSDWMTGLWGGFTIPSFSVSRRITTNGLYQKYFGDASKPGSPVPRNELAFLDIWWITPRSDLAFNSSNVVSDSFQSRFNLFQGMALSPKGSMTREQSQQQNFITKTNTDSAGVDMVWERPDIFLLFTPTALNTGFTWRNVKRFDDQARVTSDSDSYSIPTTIPFQASEGFNGSANFRVNIERKVEGTRTTITRTYVPSLEFSHNLFYAGAILDFWPFNGLKLDQAIRLQERLEATITRNQDEIPSAAGIDLKLTESERYTFGTSMQYTLSQFARLDFTGDLNYLNDRQTVGNNQLTWNVGLKLNATF